MFANRYTAFVDACSLAGALKRNLILTLAQKEFFRLRWSARILDETQRAIEKILKDRDDPDAPALAAKQRAVMEDAFEEAHVEGYEAFLPACAAFPDPDDRHVVAAALKIRASTIVTENLRHFPANLLEPLNIEARSTDSFLADTVVLEPERAVAALRDMRHRLRRPELTAEALLVKMEADGLIQTVDILRSHILSL